MVSNRQLSALLLIAAACQLCVRAAPSSADQHSEQMSREQLDEMINEFSQKIGQTMKDEMEKLIDDVDGSGSKVNERELERLKDANEIMSEDTQRRIELAGTQNSAELPQSALGDMGHSLLSQASGKLQQAGSYMSSQMSSLASWVPKIKGKVRQIPDKLRKLMQWPSFSRFKVVNNKVYKSMREELYRQLVYLHSQTIVGVQNLKYLMGKASHLLKATQFADVTESEYRDTYDNRDAERELDAATAPRPDAAAMLQLQKLAKQDKNIFGQDMGELMKHGQQQQQKEAKRRRRAASELNAEEDSDEDEDDDDSEMMDASDKALDSDDDDFDVVDEYAAEFDENADTEILQFIEDLIDDALEEQRSKFRGIDLRKTGCVPKPENQDTCGACYAYVATAAASYYNCIGQPEDENRKPVRLSSRFVSDCGRYLTPPDAAQILKGCRGGKLTAAFNFTGLAGMHPFMEYEVARVSYDYKTDNCAYPRPESITEWAPIQVPFFKATRIVYLKTNEVDLHLRTVGPVFVNLRTWVDFRNHGSGIYGEMKESDTPIIHSMWIVGHEMDKHGKEYFILWNSHGTAWGEYGFARIYADALDYYKVYIGGLITLEALESSYYN